MTTARRDYETAIDELDTTLVTHVIKSINAGCSFTPEGDAQQDLDGLHGLLQSIVDHVPGVFQDPTTGQFRAEHPDNQKSKVGNVLGRILRSCCYGDAIKMVRN